MEAIRWTVHPAKDRPRDLALVACVLFTTLAATLIAFNSAFLTGLAAVIICASVASFLFPTRYAVTDWGVEAKGILRTRARRWRDLRRVDVGPRAALVSPLATRSWLDRHRGILLQLQGIDRDHVVDVLRDRVGGSDIVEPEPADDDAGSADEDPSETDADGGA